MKYGIKRKLIFTACFLLLAGAAALVTALIHSGAVLLNNPSERDYPVRGVDVSHYQGDIDWPRLAEQGVDFAFIKATEGSGHVDEYFSRNISAAREAGLAVGAYHFFSFESPGASQAENFIAAVGTGSGLLPPVIDFEFYKGCGRERLEKSAVVAELRTLADVLTVFYGRPPIIYATEEAYEQYIAGGFADCDIWIRNVITSPRLRDGRSWTFWQYADRGRLDGFSGGEKFIDLNVFRGSEKDFERYAANEHGE